MKKLSIKNIIEFSKKSARGKKTLINNLKNNPTKLGGGGDYWISSTSALGNAFKENETQIIKDKIDYLLGEHELTSYKITKDMYKRNIEILEKYEDYDFSEWQPSKYLTFLSKPRSKSILNIKGLPIQALPSHVFTYDNNGVPTIGAIWFVAKLHGFKTSELGIFTEILHKYLHVHYSDEYQIDPNYCISVDIAGFNEVKFIEILNNKISTLLDSTIDEIKSII